MAKSKSRWPAPVYVAEYADGHSCRMSFWSDARKPIDVAAARDQAMRHRPIMRPAADYPFGIPTGEYSPLLSFRIEHMGEMVPEISAVSPRPRRADKAAEYKLALEQMFGVFNAREIDPMQAFVAIERARKVLAA